MAGQIKQMLDRIVKERSQGNPAIESTTRTKLILKGVNPTNYDSTSADNPEVISKVKLIATEFGINLN